MSPSLDWPQQIELLLESLVVSGVSTFQGNLDLQDNDKLLIGTGDDLEIYHDTLVL